MPNGGSSGASPKSAGVSDDTVSEFYLKTLDVTSANLNVREGPATEHKVLYRAVLNDELTFLARTGEWMKVRIELIGVVGYVHYKYVRLRE